MEKALHNYFYINTDGKLHLYSSKESSFLIEAANFHIDKRSRTELTENIPNLDEFIYKCVDEYFQNGISDRLLNQLNEHLKNIKIQCLFENIRGKFAAIHIAYLPYNCSPLHFSAYMFSQVASLGGLNGLKRCHNNNCLKFFIGRSNAKWCSNSCGSKYRVRKMRKAKIASCLLYSP